MKISTIAIGLMVLFAATTVAIAAGPPEDKGQPVMDAKIEISDTSVSYLFFSEENVDSWEITVNWKEGIKGEPGYTDENETYSGTIVYENGNSPSFNVQFISGDASDAGGEVTSMPITIKADGDLEYPITATAYTADGNSITVSGYLDLNPIIVEP